MLYAVAVLPAVLANTAEISTSDVRKGAAFDNLKASWGKSLNVGDFKTNMNCNYDYNDNRDFLKDVSFSGDLVEGEGDDLSVGYEVTHNFGSKNTEVKLSASVAGTAFSADYDTESSLKEVGLSRSVDVGDQKVDLSPSFLVQAKTARVKLMSALGSGGDSVSAQVDYGTDGGSVSYELGYSHNIDAGRDLSATFSPDGNNLEVEYTDTTFESGSTWTATANVPVDGNALDAAKLTLKRSWSW
jgi:hypothetical protein